MFRRGDGKLSIKQKLTHPVYRFCTRGVTAALITSILLLTFAPRAHAIIWSGELLTNPGFETGNATGWTNSGQSVSVGYQCVNNCDAAPHSGSYVAYWTAPSGSSNYVSQTVDLSGYASDIDAGKAVINATGWFISDEVPSQDLFYMQVRFYDGLSNELVASRYDTGTQESANWTQYGITGYTIPNGVRSVEIRFNTWEDTWGAGSADDFSVNVGTTGDYDIYRMDSSWHTGLTGYTAPAGSNRLLVFITGLENNGDNEVTNVTYGGQGMTEAVGYVTTAAGYVARCEIWYLKEADIPSGSNDFSVSYAAVGPDVAFHAAATYANVDQSSPFVDTAQNEDSVTPIDNPIEAMGTVLQGGVAIAGAAAGNDGSYTWGNGWTEGTDQPDSASGFTMSTADHSAVVSGTDIASATHSGPNRQVVVVVSLRPYQISRLDTTWHTGLTGYTAPAGINRLLVFITGLENDADNDVTNVTYGGQPMSEALGYVTTAAGYVARCEIWYLREADIPGGSNDFVVTYALGAPLMGFHAAATYRNVDQSNTFVDTSQSEDSSAPIDNPIEATGNVLQGGVAIAGAAAGNDGSYTWGNGWSEGTDQTENVLSGFNMSTAEHTIAADGTDTASATHTNPNRNIIVVVSLRPSSNVILTQTHYRWRYDDGGEGTGFTGDGSDGSLTVTVSDAVINDYTYLTGNESSGTTSIDVNDATNFSDGDEILIIQMQGSGSFAPGTYEFKTIQSKAGNTLTLTSGLNNAYGSGTFDTANAFATQVVRVPQYTNVTVNGGASITANAWDGYTGGIVAFRATGGVNVNGSIDVSGKGYRGGSGGTTGTGTAGAGQNGESYDGKVGSGGDDQTPGAGGGLNGTSGGGAGSGFPGVTSTSATRGGGGGGNVDSGNANDGAGGGGGGGHGYGGGGGGGGSDGVGAAAGSGGAGGDGTSPVNDPIAGGGGAGEDNTVGGAGGAVNTDGGGTNGGLRATVTTQTGYGGGSECNTCTGVSAGGGGGGGTYGEATLNSEIHLGSGGGGGGGKDGTAAGADGGTGGGVIFIAADTVTVSGTISTGGGAGGTAGTADGGGGGGGAGGSIMIQAYSATLGADLVSARGGAGGGVNDNGGGGGGGAHGRIRVESDDKVGTVSTDPTYSSSGTPSGGGSGASWATPSEDTKLDGLAIDTTIRLRFQVSNEGDQSSGNVTYQLRVAETDTCASGSYTAVPDTASSSEHWEIVDSSYITDGEQTYNVNPGLTDPGSGTFKSGEVRDNTSNVTSAINLSASEFTEIEFAIEATGYATDGGDYCFILYDTTGGSTLDAYPVYAQVQLANGIFSYRKPITIRAVNLGGSCSADLDDFPVLISLTDTDLASKAKADGYDIIFRALNDTICDDLAPAPCTLDHEIEKWDSETGELIAWVRIPKLYSSSDTTIYMYYGNPNVYQPTENPAGVWDANYVGVWHLNETTGTHYDSTSYGNNGTPGGGVIQDAAGKISGGDDFDGNDDYVEIGTTGWTTANMTFSAWARVDALADHRYLFGHTTQPAYANRTQIYTSGTAPTLLGLGLGDTHAKDTGSALSDVGEPWYHIVLVKNATNYWVYLNKGVDMSGTYTGLSTFQTYADIGNDGNPFERTESWNGVIDEVRISNIPRDACWIQTSFNSQDNPGDIGYDGFYSVGTEEGTPVTAVGLLSFTARGQGSSVLVEWETAQEVRNMGFNLYRAESLGGPFTRLNKNLIPGLTFSVKGKSYSFVDTHAKRGTLYYYKLEDIDVSGKRTMHGPISVDWDADGMPDDWEIAYGFNPLLNDAHTDLDGDGLTNLEEYEHETDPLNPDSDGDGIPDGQESGKVDRGEPVETRTITQGIQVVASDDSGVTLELRTDNYEMEIVQVGEQVFQRLRISDYIHGFTNEIGKPELPMKGLLLDLPDGVSATLKIEDTESKNLSGYWIYPVPETAVSGEKGAEHVAEFFAIDDAAYSSNVFYPQVVAELGETYVFREQQKRQVRFYPFTFNPETRELKYYTRIRVRVEYDVASSVTRSVSRALALPVPSSPSASRRALAWTPPSVNPVYKIPVSDEGIYRLTEAWLKANGVYVGSGIALDQIRLYNLGQELAVHVYDEDGDNRFDPNDYIEFYGRAIEAPYAKYTKENVYWLTDSGVPGALRMGVIDGTPVSSPAITHTSTVRHERDEAYVNLSPGDDALDRWYFSEYAYGTGITGGPNPVPVNLSMPLPGVGGQGSLKISMLGLADTDHEVEVSVNGIVRSYTWSGLVPFEATIDSVDLFDGSDPSTLTVTFRCLSGIDPLDPDGIAVDWMEVTYPRAFVARNDELKFSHDAGSAYQVSGFSGSELLAFDITSATDVRQINVPPAVDMGGSYTLDLEPQYGTGERTYLVLSTTQLKVPIAITEVVDPDLSNGSNGADYILITHRDLGWDGTGIAYPWLSNLVALRESQGLRVKVVDVEDVYHEFGYGIVTPQAIKDFLTHAYNNWVRPAPQYVLLVGDSTYDYKDNLGLGTINYVPTYLSWTNYMGETLTDDWFARVSGNDAVPDLYIGRLPAASVAEADAMVSKIISYESTLNSKTWEKNVLLVADDQTADYEAIFEFMSNDVAALIPAGMNSPFTEYLANYTNPADLTVAIKDKINNDGTLIVNYSGHGSVQIWTLDPIFENADVASLTNINKLPFIVSMTCLTGFFGYPEAWNYPSLAEVLMRAANKGAVAAFMSTGMTQPEGQRILDAALFDAIFKQDNRALGAAISVAKQTLLANGAGFEDVSKTFLLFGDPATKLKIPLPTVPSWLVAQVQNGAVVLSWQGGATDCDGAAVSGYNVYRSATPGGPYTKVNTDLITEAGFTDTSVQTGTYYYVITAVDSDGDESAPSTEVSVVVGAKTVSTTSAGGGGGGGGCFISAIAN